MSGADLSGKTLVVTRPAHQGEALCNRLRQQGAQVIHFPLLEIEPAAPTAEQAATLARLGQFTLAVFISPNAVRFGLAAVAEHGGWPTDLPVAAVGQSTARALHDALGRGPDLVPEGEANSEALLELPSLQRVAGQRIAIFRGIGGRELLANTLRDRGAEVTYIEVYQRRPPTIDRRLLLEPGRRGEIDAISVTSSESLRNLYDLEEASGRNWLLATPLIVVGERTAALARELGFSRIAVATAADDDALIAAFLQNC